MHRWKTAALCLGLAFGPLSAHAQETQTYVYDVHGRLTSVTRVQGSSTRTTTYGLDAADNRTSRNMTVSLSAIAAEDGDEPASIPREAAAEEEFRPAADGVSRPEDPEK